MSSEETVVMPNLPSKHEIASSRVSSAPDCARGGGPHEQQHRVGYRYTYPENFVDAHEKIARMLAERMIETLVAEYVHVVREGPFTTLTLDIAIRDCLRPSDSGG